MCSVKDRNEFSILDLDELNTIEKFKQIENELITYYIPCKKIKYFKENMDYRAILTILKQFLKVYNYDLEGREKFIRGIKYTIYRIMTKEEKKIIKRIKRIPNKSITLIFD